MSRKLDFDIDSNLFCNEQLEGFTNLPNQISESMLFKQDLLGEAKKSSCGVDTSKEDKL